MITDINTYNNKNKSLNILPWMFDLFGFSFKKFLKNKIYIQSKK